jgi:hypothetical protein
MQRRDFLNTMLAGAAIQRLARTQTTSGVFFERPVAGTPNKGKVLAAIQPHSDDIAIFAAGTVAKLIEEGYTGYMIRATNDDMGDDAGEPGAIGENVLRNERENAEAARVLGLERSFDLNYNNHRMGDVSWNELICRLIFLIRLLKLDTVFCYDPLGTRRGESRPLRALALAGSGLLDGRPRARLSRAVRRRAQAARGPREVLLRAPSGNQSRGGHQRRRR